MIDALPGGGVSPTEMRGILEGQVDIPWKDVPLAGLRVVIIVHILLWSHVGVVNCEVHRVEGEVVVEVEVGLPLRLGGSAAVEPLEGKEVRLVADLVRTLGPLGRSRPAVDIIEVAIGHVAGLKELDIGLLDRDVEPPEVTVVLVRRRLR